MATTSMEQQEVSGTSTLSPPLSSQDIDHILRVIQVVLKEEKRYSAIPNYGETVQKNKCMSVWRLQLITWLMEVSRKSVSFLLEIVLVGTTVERITRILYHRFYLIMYCASLSDHISTIIYIS